MTGMDRWIDWDKADFIGADAARREHATDSAARGLVTLEVDAADADASGYEPVWADDYGHTIGRSLAMALVDREYTAEGTELTTHIVGVRNSAQVIAPAPYDPNGTALRA